MSAIDASHETGRADARPRLMPGLEPGPNRARELARSANVVPVRYRFVDDLETPVSAFLKLRGDGPAFLLESAEQGRLGRWSFLGFRPRSILRWSEGKLSEWDRESASAAGSGATPDRVIDAPDPYGAVADYLGRFQIAEPDDLPPFAGGAVGFFGYDLVRTVEPLGEPNPDPLGLPDMALMISDVLIAFDHQRHEVTLIANAFVEDGGIDDAYARAAETIAEVRERMREPVAPVDAPARPGDVSFESNMSRERFEGTVARIIEYVHAGDAFQVVPSQRFTARTPVEAFSIYRGLRTVNPSPYMYFLDFGDFVIAGASPEPLV